MLLKLIPPPSQPTVHFSLNLPTFPTHLEPPQSYTARINHLLVEDLEMPNTLHSLDKSVWLMSLLEEVMFEIKDGGGRGDQCTAVHVTCQFVDGAVEEWVSDCPSLISALEDIVDNVQESTMEDDKERERLCLQSQVKNNRPRALNMLSMPPGPPTMTGSRPKHKKQRSLFMQIVSSIVNITSPSPSSHLPTFVDPSHPEAFHSPPPPPSDTPPLKPPSSKRARFLRRTARSSLVDAYRRHVLSELTRRFPKEGGFGVWILHSMKRRVSGRMEDLVQEATRVEQKGLELRQRHEQEQEQQYLYQQDCSDSPIHERLLGPSVTMEETAFSATTMTVPLSFSDEGSSIENESESPNLSKDGTGNGDEVEDDLETVTDDSSIHTPSSTSHIGSGFMDGNSLPFSPTSSSPSTSSTTRPSLSNPEPLLTHHFHFEYTQLSRQRQRLHSLILFADSQTRIAEDEKRNREEILLVRGRRRAWLNGELRARKGGAATTTGNGIVQTQWGFSAPFKSSPLARYSWDASTEPDESTDNANHTSPCLPPSQQRVDEDDDDEFLYDEFHGPPIVRNSILSYPHGRQFRRSRYVNGRGLGKKLLPVTEEFEYEYDQDSTLDVNPGVNGADDGVINVQFYHPPGLEHLDDSFHHRDDSFLHHHHHHQGDGDIDNDFSLEDPRELDLELGFGLQYPNPFVGEDGQELFTINRREHRRSDESIRIAFEMERPKIIPGVRDSLNNGDDDSMSISTTRSGGLLSWGSWSVGKNNVHNDGGNGDNASRKCWKNGIGIGLVGRGRSVDKTCRQRRSEEEEEHFPRLRHRVSTSSTSSASSTSSTKSQQQQYRREPAQVEPEAELHQNQDQDQKTTPLLCQPVSFSISHTTAPAVITALPQSSSTNPATTPATITPMTVAIPPPNDTAPSPKDTTKEMPNETNTKIFVPTPPLSFTTKKLCMTSTPNVYADIDVSVVHVGDASDDKSKNLDFVPNHQSILDNNVTHIGDHSIQSQAQGGLQAPPRLRPRRHKREYQYQCQQQHHTSGNDICQDECDEYKLSGFGQFEGPHYHQYLHPRHELLLEEGLYGCDRGDQEEFTLAMDVPLSAGRGGNTGFVVAGKRKRLRKIQYLHLHQNRDPSQQPRLQQLHRQGGLGGIEDL